MNKLVIDMKWVSVVLLLALIGLTIWTKPWDMGSSRTISVTGEGTITAVPDEFQFNVTYQKTAAAVADANSQVAAIGNEVVKKLKELGLNDKQIKTNLSSNPSYEIAPDRSGSTKEYSSAYIIAVKVENKEQAQKVQDYLATTPVQYSYSPNATFSAATQDKLEDEAREKAIANARKKAEKTAQELGVKVGRVVSVSDLVQSGGPITLMADKATSSASAERVVAPTIEAGSQDLTFTLNVTYQIR